MPSRFGIGMRWWLALVFGVIAAVTAVAVWQVLSSRAERAFRAYAEEIAVVNARGAEGAVARAVGRGDLEDAVPVIATRREIALFVFDRDGNLVSPARTRRTDLGAVPQREEAVRTARAGQTFVAASEDGESTVVAIPLRAPESGALLAYAPRPELAAGLGIAREKIAQTALWAAISGAVAGLLVAALITARLRRINAAAAAIEQGDFDVRIQPGFGDELGELADSVDRMRVRLKESFAALAGERDRLHVLLERLREGILTIDSGLRVEYANAAARRMLPVEVGRELPDELRRLALGLFAPGAEIVEMRLLPDEEHVLSVVGIPGVEPLFVLTDVSERERRERAQREFVANAAHELRTPLSVISGAVEMLDAGAKDVPEERDRFLGHIAEESARLGRLARALLLLARAETRAETLRVEPIALRPLLEQVAAGLRTRPGVAVEVHCPEELDVTAQAELAQQIVFNLADNAARHTERGRIVLAARPAGRTEAAIEVSDTGPGIPQAEQEAVFERFHRGDDRNGEGFGLGLAIVRQAVRVLGGRVELESAVGDGTTVRVVLPR